MKEEEVVDRAVPSSFKRSAGSGSIKNQNSFKSSISIDKIILDLEGKEIKVNDTL